MTQKKVLEIKARDNPTLQRMRRVSADPQHARRERLCWLDGDHLVRAAMHGACVLEWLVYAPEGWARPELRALADHVPKVAVLAPGLMKVVAAVETPADMGALIRLPEPPAINPAVPTVVLDRVQDPGNVGTILRSASAFGFAQVVALKGTAALWSVKVVRAAMGAHFSLALIEQAHADDLGTLKMPWIGTSSHAAECLGERPLPRPCAWVVGHEGGGLDATLARRCERLVRIAQPGGQESLNVAVAASICLYESTRGQ